MKMSEGSKIHDIIGEFLPDGVLPHEEDAPYNNLRETWCNWCKKSLTVNTQKGRSYWLGWSSKRGSLKKAYSEWTLLKMRNKSVNLHIDLWSFEYPGILKPSYVYGSHWSYMSMTFKWTRRLQEFDFDFDHSNFIVHCCLFQKTLPLWLF